MSTTDSIPTTRTRLPATVAFAIVAATFVAVFLGSGTPVPLYNTYRAEDGVTSAGLAITTVVYLATTALALLTTGRLSNHIGRRPMAIAAALCAAAGCLVMLDVHGLPELMVGRILQGIGCGAATSALGSYVLDLSPARPSWLGPVITSNAPPFAIPVGALLSGALVQYAPAPRFLIYSLVAGLLVVLAILLALCPETVARRPGALASLRPRVLIPQGRRRLLFAVGAGLVGTWSLSGFYQAFSPVLAADELGTTNALVVAMVFSSIVVLSPIGGLLTGRYRATTAMRIGLTVFVIGTAAVLLALHLGQIWWFLGASALAGIAQGSANAGGMRAILGDAAPGDRAGLLATLYLISYSGAALPGLAAGRLTEVLAPDQIAYGYGVIVLLCALTAFAALRGTGARPTPAP